MRIAVIGAGALGTLFGASFVKNGHEVWLIHHSDTYTDRIEANGVEVVSAFESKSETGQTDFSVSVNATTEGSEVGEVDLALVLVKAHHTRTALRSHSGCIGPSTIVLSLQNGLRNYDHISVVVDTDQILTGVTYTGADVLAPGEVKYESTGRTIFGGSDEETRARIERVFREAGFTVQTVSDPTPHIWEKVMWSLSLGPTCALTRLQLYEMYTTEELRHTMEQAIDEALDVAAARGVELSFDAQDVLTDMEGKVNKWREGDGQPSMLGDVKKQRKTEIDEINGAVVEYGEEVGVKTPTNRLLTGLVRGLESSYLD